MGEIGRGVFNMESESENSGEMDCFVSSLVLNSYEVGLRIKYLPKRVPPALGS